MNIQQALDFADGMKPNAMDRQMKLAYLTEVEQLFVKELVLTHKHTTDQETLPVYTEDTDAGTELLIPDPDCMVYVYWLMAKIDMQNLEADKWDQDTQRFEQAWGTLADRWTRNHMPITQGCGYRV